MAENVQVDNWCCTKMRVDRYTYLWKINNFSYCREETGETLKSSSFTTGPDKLQWYGIVLMRETIDHPNFITLQRCIEWKFVELSLIKLSYH